MSNEKTLDDALDRLNVNCEMIRKCADEVESLSKKLNDYSVNIRSLDCFCNK